MNKLLTKKKNINYQAPSLRIIKMEFTLMTTASPGIGGDYAPGMAIEAKRNSFDDFDDEDFE